MAAPLLRDVWETCCKNAGTGNNSCFIDGALGLDKTLYRCLQMSTDEGTNTFFFFREKTQFGKKVIQTGPCCSYCIKFDP